jgi:hypothetical protein
MTQSASPTGSEALAWRGWIGLPHVIGADPRDGEAACCLVMASVVLASGGIELPMGLDHWLSLAREGSREALELGFQLFTSPLQEPEQYALTLMENGEAGLGLGVVVEPSWLLTCHHSRGVIALPLRALKAAQFRKIAK